jgi:hypothetical protein
MGDLLPDALGQLGQPHVVAPGVTVSNPQHPLKLAGAFARVEEHLAEAARIDDLGAKQVLLIPELTRLAQLQLHEVHPGAGLQPNRATEPFGQPSGVLREERFTIRVDRRETRSDAWLDQKSAEQFLHARGVRLVPLERCELAGYLHGGMVKADQPLTREHAPGEEGGLKDRPFTLVGVVRNQQHEAIRAPQAFLDRVEPILARLDLHLVQEDVDLAAAEPLQGLPEHQGDIRVLRALVAQEDPKPARDGVERLLGRLHQGFGFCRPLPAQTLDATPELSLVLREARRKRFDLRMGHDLLHLLGLERDDGFGQISGARHRAALR